MRTRPIPSDAPRRRLQTPTPARLSLAALTLAALALPAQAAAQLPELPVLQNGFTRPGFAAAVNFGAADESSTLALAGGWSPGAGRLQFSGGIGVFQPPGDESSRASAGARVAFAVPTPWTGKPTSALGLTAFGGIGGSWREGGTLLQVPVGVGIGYRRGIGATRALSVYATPFYTFVRRTAEDETDDPEADDDTRSNLFRTSVGVDFTLTRAIGLTAGYEFGAKAEAGRPGPRGGIFGAGLSYAF